MTSRTSHISYEFSEFRLDPGARELWRGGELVDLPPLPFDVLTFLVENRERAVSRDELITAVWKKSYVDEMRVTQLVMRLRRAIGDDSDQPRFIRAVPGVGYRWIAETDELEAAAPGTTEPAELRAAGRRDPPGADVQALERLPHPTAADTAASPPARQVPAAPAVPAVPWLRRWQVLAPLTLTIALLLLAVIYFRARHGWGAAPLPREPGEAIAVLPLEISAPENANAGWVRLGAMDLIAERLRDAGLPVPPSDSVISALHAAGELPETERLTTLRRTLGAGVLIEGKATQATDGWTLELVATATDGDRRRVASEPAEVIPAASQAADLLLAALGETAPVAGRENKALSELLQRARAALLALELDTARELLTQAPEPLRNAPELRHELAWVEYRAGRLEEAEAIATELLDDPAVAERPRLRAQALTVLGYVTGMGRSWADSEPYFDAAVTTLADEPWTPELGTALAMRGLARTFLHRFDAALSDLGQARAQFEASGDRMGLVRINNYFGNLALERRHPDEATSFFKTSLAISESFGHTDGVRANGIAMLIAQMSLLRWPEALETTERLWTLRDRIEDPVWHNQIQVARALVLLTLGRHSEAETLLADSKRNAPGLPHRAVRETQHARAELAWQLGRPREALAAAAEALELWLTEKELPLHQIPGILSLALLHQRASIAAGRPMPAAHMLLDSAETAASLELGKGSGVIDVATEAAIADNPAYRVAQAEWAAHHGDSEEAERRFRDAMALAESWGVPQTIVLAADAQTRWLLEQDRIPEALALAGRVAVWADHDFDSALLQVLAFHAAGQRDAWTTALRRAQSLAGEREIPPELLIPPE